MPEEKKKDEFIKDAVLLSEDEDPFASQRRKLLADKEEKKTE